MGLKCLLGHDFGPPAVVREHEEDGNEMVVIEREVQTCERCGEEQVISETTEVRAIRSEAEMGLHDEDVEAVTPAHETDDVGGAGDSAMSEEMETPMDAADADPAPAASTGGADVGASDTPADAAEDDSSTSIIERAEAGLDDPSPGEEDAVILDDEDDSAERGHGEWPDTDDADVDVAADAADDGDELADEAESAERTIAETAAEEDAELLGSADDDTDDTDDGESTEASRDAGSPAAGSAWPAHEGADEGYAADAASSGGPDVSFGNTIAPHSNNGETPNQTADGYDTAYPGATVEERDGDGTIVSARGSTPENDPRIETEYYCPNCDHTRPLGSSLRKGDICPECQRGYIAERER